MREDSRELATIWLRYIEDDLKVAATVADELPAIAAFHVQQAVEKSFKAVIVMEGRDPPRIHDLKRLFALIEQKLGWVADEVWLSQVSSWVATSRYPTDIAQPMPMLEDVRSALASAKALSDEIRRKLV